MSDDLVKFLRTEAEEAAKQASRDWDEEDEKRIAFAVLRDKLYEAAARITALEAENKRLREALEPTSETEIEDADFTDDESQALCYVTVSNEIEHGKWQDTEGLLMNRETVKILNAFLSYRRRAAAALEKK